MKHTHAYTHSLVTVHLYFEIRTSLVVQWLRLLASSARGVGSMPGWGIKVLHATCMAKSKNKKKIIAESAPPRLFHNSSSCPDSRLVGDKHRISLHQLLLGPTSGVCL